MSSKPFPNNREVEAAVLGSILLNSDALYQVIDTLDANDFYYRPYQIIYTAFLDLFHSGRQIELLALSQHLEASDKLKDAGNLSGLAALLNAITTTSNIKRHAQIVKDLSIRRQLIMAQHKNVEVILDESKDINAVLAEAQGNIVSINAVHEVDDSAKTILRELEAVQEEYAKKAENNQKLLGYSCGFEKIDSIIDGLQPGHIWVVGGWTSTGKTQFALNIVNAVLSQGVPTTIVSLEMSRVDTIARLIGIRVNESAMTVKKGVSNLQLRHRIEQEKDFLFRSNLYVHTTFFELEKVKMIIRKDVYSKGVKFVVVDYVQNIISSDGQREYDLMTRAATELQALAGQLNITIYIVSQISNESEKGGGAGAGFKGTGTLEAVADIAIRLKRNRDKEDPDDNYVPVKILITKNRHGHTGTCEDYCMWLKSGKFEAGLVYIPPEARGQQYGGRSNH